MNNLEKKNKKNLEKDLEFQKRIDKVFLEGFKEEYLLGVIYKAELKDDINTID